MDTSTLKNVSNLKNFDQPVDKHNASFPEGRECQGSPGKRTGKAASHKQTVKVNVHPREGKETHERSPQRLRGEPKQRANTKQEAGPTTAVAEGEPLKDQHNQGRNGTSAAGRSSVRQGREER